MKLALLKKLDQYFDKNYLDRCQVSTPDDVVQWVWSMVHKKRRFKKPHVLDLGCGDGRFSKYGKFKQYLGIEIDKNHSVDPFIPSNTKIVNSCALINDFIKFDICIGNPPYVRHHDMDSAWQKNIANRLSKDSKTEIDLRANAFLYFMLKGLLSTKDNGLVAHVVPFEWVTRPSSEWLREYIRRNKWSVSVYRLPENIFSRVLTTSSLTIINKAKKNNVWEYFNVDNQFSISKIPQPSGTKNKVIRHSNRIDDIYAQRGLSPGGQNIFCLTEEERLHNRLRANVDVVPCVTTMKHLPDDVKVLTKIAFKKYYIDQGQRCWLIRSDKKNSSRLSKYLKAVSIKLKNNWTCNSRKIWYEYKFPNIPKLLFSSGFVKRGPRVLENKIGAVAVGGASNIFMIKGISSRYIANAIRQYDFESRVVNQSGKLKKIEMNQMNTVLITLFKKYILTSS